MKVAVPLPKTIFAPFRITATALPTDAGIQKKIYGSGRTPLIVWNEDEWHFENCLSSWRLTFYWK